MPRALIEKFDVGVVPFGVSYGDETYHTDFYDLTAKAFFAKCRAENIFPKTSQPTYAHYEERLRPALSAGADVICLCITSKFSGSYQSGVMAMNNLKEEFPDRRILVMDSRRCTVLHGYLVYQACLMAELAADHTAEESMDFDQIVSNLTALLDDQITYVAVDNLEYLRKGGRLGKASALAGSLLDIKPIITFADGELQPHSKVRGKKKAMAEIIRTTLSAVGDRKDQYVPIVLSSDMPIEVAELAETLKSHGFGPPIHTWDVGPVAGAHLGPTGFGVTLLKKYPGQKEF